MVKVKYYAKMIEFSQKNQKVMYVFKRLPTKEQLEKFEADLKNPTNHQNMKIMGLGNANMFQIFEEREPELELNWDKVRIVVSVKHAHELGLKIGDVVLLDIPEDVMDIKIQESKN